MNEDVRWEQRFANFDRALSLLRSALRERPLSQFSELEREGIAQRFEYTFELAWKTLKDYLEASGLTLSPVTPRQVFKEGFSAKILADGQLWIEMMLHRNMLSHRYDFATFAEVLEAVNEHYLPALERLHATLAAQRKGA